MTVSIFDLFSIGIGPSSSHTVGPMKAAARFAGELKKNNLLAKTQEVKVELYGSLALTGKGHSTDIAVLNGLEGQLPNVVSAEKVLPRAKEIISQEKILLNGEHLIPFKVEKDLLFHYEEALPYHSNAVKFTALDENQKPLLEKIFYSIGGGFIIDDAEKDSQPKAQDSKLPYPFSTADELLALCKKHQLSIAQLMMENEKAWQTEAVIKEKLLRIHQVMSECIHHGMTSTEEFLPGPLNLKRRAPGLYQKLLKEKKSTKHHFDDVINWVNLYALAVNEENAAGGRIVTAPTNGAAGIIPSVLTYYTEFCENPSEQGVLDFLLTAGAIALLYKMNASISAAEVGCQGEVGVASSMAAGALTAVLGGTLDQIENAAEISMEHHLGLTCDPIAGLVQIPCIERNAMGSNQAINAAKLALMGSGEHYVSLDHVIKTMFETGKNMQTIYKETSKGGLAVNVPEC